MPLKNYYAILGIPRDATPEQIKKVYRRLVRQHHPDINKGISDARIKVLNEAYSILSDPQQRALYDIQLLEEIRNLRVLEAVHEHYMKRTQKMTWSQGVVGFMRELKKEMHRS